MIVLYTLICRSYLFLYTGPTYSYMPVLRTRIFQSIILLYAGRGNLIFRSYLFVYAGPIYSYMPVLLTPT